MINGEFIYSIRFCVNIYFVDVFDEKIRELLKRPSDQRSLDIDDVSSLEFGVCVSTDGFKIVFESTYLVQLLLTLSNTFFEAIFFILLKLFTYKT